MVDVVIPVYKPDDKFFMLFEKLLKQTVLPGKIILMVTREEGVPLGGLKDKLKGGPAGLELYSISKDQFDHGGTRHKAAGYSNAEFLLYMTQDAVPSDSRLIENMLKPFQDESIAAVYARQTAQEDADAVEIYARAFNYPAESRKKTKGDIRKLGIKTYFLSNVCAAYRRSIYNETGGFYKNSILNEDMLFAAKALEKGYGIYYNAEAVVCHSHNYFLMEQFRRNFDIGVSQRDFRKYFDGISSEKEGIALTAELFSFLLDRKEYFLLAYFVLECIFKYCGYLLGRHYPFLPEKFILLFTRNKGYWLRKWKRAEKKFI